MPQTWTMRASVPLKLSYLYEPPKPRPAREFEVLCELVASVTVTWSAFSTVPELKSFFLLYCRCRFPTLMMTYSLGDVDL